MSRVCALVPAPIFMVEPKMVRISPRRTAAKPTGFMYNPTIYYYDLLIASLERNGTDMPMSNFQTEQMAAVQGITEQLKSENQMLWVGWMNNIWACADEIVRSELIYD